MQSKIEWERMSHEDKLSIAPADVVNPGTANEALEEWWEDELKRKSKINADCEQNFDPFYK